MSQILCCNYLSTDIKISALMVVAHKSVKSCPGTFPWLQTVHGTEQSVGVE
jgi:hypothetical protein